ncbi:MULTISPECIES: hypothetical protein [Aequorivita]|uniref:Lipocalin-like domain-containing protein n=2 Tax=Aequorivita TaxID=153265 RepID=A0AB35YP60_9FLAO|nr:hypothetical protein [Aequorivita sp. Ant34-E75]WGF93369.1 hypothetical protein QCQ61_04055 [Aequorivita sp. Ant34-E75]
MMKISKLFILCILAVATISCSSDDDNNPPPYTLSTTNFVDTYKLKFLEIREVETITFSNGTTSTSSAVTVGSVFQNVNFVFNSNNTYTANGLFNTVTTVTNPDGSTTVGDTVIVSLDETGTYTLNVGNSTLTVTDSDGEVTALEISDYTETSMTLYAEETTVSNNSTIVTSVEYRFSR